MKKLLNTHSVTKIKHCYIYWDRVGLRRVGHISGYTETTINLFTQKWGSIWSAAIAPLPIQFLVILNWVLL